MTAITESEQQELEEDPNTAAIMRTVDAISRLRAELAADESPTIRSGTPAQLSEFFDLANDLELQVGEWIETLGDIQATLSAVTALYPESLAYGEG